MRFLDWLRNKNLSDDKVSLSVGSVRLYELNKGMIDRVTIKSTITGTLMNDALYFSLMEQELWSGSARSLQGLSVRDANALRDVVRSVLLRHGLISEAPPEPVKTVVENVDVAWSVSDQEQFDQMTQKLERYKAGIQ